ncbi:MAG: hypothetical protein PHD76_10965 [Methylacidiphilales bacterium]|nr:hypothetical protein [Candidatus Methylacidiphilales bacterium]
MSDYIGASLHFSPIFHVARYDVDSTVELGYRYAAYCANIATVLVGTGSVKHLRENIRSVGKGPLPAELLQELARHFGHLEHVSGS